MTTNLLPDILVSAEWLKDNLHQKNLVLFDASWHMPATNRDGYVEWQAEHIKGARFFDYDRRICLPDSDLPHMMPDASLFNREVQLLGLNQESFVVVYDSLGLVSGPRAWWMLRSMGCENCALLDGGLPAWRAAGYPTTNEVDAYEEGDFIVNFKPGYFVDSGQVSSALDTSTSLIIDARSAERFRGEVDEPRPGLRRGHMPGASNLPFPELFDDGRMKDRQALKTIFSQHISDQEQIICSCGSGITACVIALGATLAGYDNITIYDGSWCDWGRPGELPVIRP